MLKPLIERWLGRPRSTTPTWDLSTYPGNDVPHPGHGQAVTEAQAQQNWAQFQATLPERQRVLRDWLVAHGGPDSQALAGLDYARALNAWAKAHWDRLPPFKRLPPHRPWPECPRSGPFVVYSLLGDLALSLGEAIRQANGHWRWGLNLDAVDLADGMHSARRVVLLAPLTRPRPEAAEVSIDVEASVFPPYQYPDDVGFVLLTPWAQLADDAISGRYYDF
ncbi:hypothetical protein [Pelomonas cellulosilytica]|uniref:Uncharacterized protein n=1 Tax=Pelomonas cellulosilytica TaxID=2906762 RepID=A0ABS8XQL3_9BURK|nr:hypothetical protein [Pelomonas sp. P8]MCE4553443.1 hypothetical protein [Pelomonas sp. P8]